jgi:dTDP-4-dehydrorhamnose reductase
MDGLARDQLPLGAATSMPALELWGGLECTVVRIGDKYRDQTVLNGHQDRPGDLDAFAALGLTALRYPVLWERVAPEGLDRADWRWTDERLAQLRQLGVRPIAGLVHHGSGPRTTDLSRPDFATGLARYAGAVAERYPWLDHYTPVNEPLTTARFSGLYGHWYPHARDYRLFLRMLFNQVNGVRLAMRAIRQVNPRARLVQTDDLGRVLATPHLAYQAAYENERRWLSFDLLTGRFDRHHPLWRDVTEAVPAAELDALLADPCPPDIIGINHYLSGERFLDERVDRYPGIPVGGNGRDRYVDVLALRVAERGVAGFESLLEEAWERYGLPLAVTEVHNGSSRDEQMRWLKEAWTAAGRLRSRGVDVRGITAWSLLGTFDWDSLLTRSAGYYEPGVFDISGGKPRPTALAGLIRDLARTGEADHPVLDGAGWWHRDIRLAWDPTPPCPSTLPRRMLQHFVPPAEPRPLLITGAGGSLANAVARVCNLRGLPYQALSRAELDLADPASIAAAIERWRPWAVVNAAGCSRVDRAEAEPERCRRENILGPRMLAEACRAAGLPLVAFSSHLVFGGDKAGPYLEGDEAAPRGIYAAAKAEAERIMLAEPDVLLVRAGSFFGPWDGRNTVTRAIEAVQAGGHFAAAADVTLSPSYLPDVADAVLDLLIDGETGLWHLANDGAATWADIAREAVGGAGLDGKRVLAVPHAELGWRAPRPARSALRSTRAALMPGLETALGAYLRTLRSGRAESGDGIWLSRYRSPA